MNFKRWPQNYHLIKIRHDDYPFFLSGIRSLGNNEFFQLIVSHQEISAVLTKERLEKCPFKPESEEGDWSVFSLIPTWDINSKGIIAKFSSAMAQAGLSIGVFSSFDSDHLMVKNQFADQVDKILKELQV